MKFELSRNYKLAFNLLNQGETLAAWLDRGIHRDIGKANKSQKGDIAISANMTIYCYLPTIYNDFDLHCQKFNIEFLIPKESIKEDLRDRARNKPKNINDLRHLMGTEKVAIVGESS